MAGNRVVNHPCSILQCNKVLDTSQDVPQRLVGTKKCPEFVGPRLIRRLNVCIRDDNCSFQCMVLCQSGKLTRFGKRSGE